MLDEKFKAFFGGCQCLDCVADKKRVLSFVNERKNQMSLQDKRQAYETAKGERAIIAADEYIKALQEELDRSAVKAPVLETSKQGDRMLQHFTYAHLKDELQLVSKPICELAHHLVETLPRNPERTVALRKLLEAKDCAVRARLYRETE